MTETTENTSQNALDVPPGYNSETARAAFEHFSEVAKKLPPGDVERLNVDPNDATLRTVRMGTVANRPEIFARFELLKPAGFHIQHVTDLPNLGWALYHARLQWRQKEVTFTEAKLPMELVSKATTLRTRMLLLVSYYLGDHPVEKTEIDDIRIGTGYLDLGGDLERLAGLYDRHDALLSTDKKYYGSTDAADARELNITIMSKLSEGLTPAYREHADLVARIFTLLRKSYNEVRAAATWLFRDEPEMLAEFPGIRSTPSGSSPAKPKTQDGLAGVN